MIDLVKQTPIGYSEKSRDYQIIARLYTALFNFNKMYTDDLSIWNSNIDNKLTTLRAKTLNFNPKHNWELDDLDAAISCFKYITRTKGTLEAIKLCIMILMRINQIEGRASVEYEGSGTVNINIKVPDHLAATGVVEDLLLYILPVGITHRTLSYKIEDADLTTVLTTNNLLSEGKSIHYADMGIYIGDKESSEHKSSEHQGYSLYHNSVYTSKFEDREV